MLAGSSRSESDPRVGFARVSSQGEPGFKRRKPDEGYDAYAFSSFAGVAAAAAAAADAITLSRVGQGGGGQSNGGHGSNGVGNGTTRVPESSAGSGDAGIGVPPFRTAPSKESPTMARTPFSVAPATPLASPTAIQPPPAQSAQRLPVQLPHPPAPDLAERRTLVVGRGISVQGTVQDAERLVVEGTVEASMIRAAELSISPGGVFKGEVEVEDAEIAGTIDGTLTARSSLIVRASGRVLGTAHCKRLQVEDGGQITGRIEMLTDGSPPAPSSASARPAATEPAL
jgi:cytoskeletal protein CcmA (bactofilin family)